MRQRIVSSRLVLLMVVNYWQQGDGAFIPVFAPHRIRHNVLARDSLNWLQGSSNEANVIKAIKKCRSAHDVNQISSLGDIGPHGAAVALHRMVILTSGRGATNVDRELAREQIPMLLETVGRALLSIVRGNWSEPQLNPYALADILGALAKCDYKESTVPLANHVCQLMVRHDEKLVRTLGPRRLVDCLESLAALELDHAIMIQRMCNRLQQGDALALLEARHLATALKSLVLMEHLEHTTVIKALLRRWRKQAVHQRATSTDICQALYAARRLIRLIKDDSLYTETEVMVHTLLRELSPYNATGSRSLTAGQIAETLTTACAFRVNSTHPVWGDLLDRLLHEAVLARASVPDIARILLSMKRLNQSSHAEVVQRLGSRFLALVLTEPVESRTANAILRSAVLMHQHNSTVMEPFVTALRFLILKSVHRDGSPFLSTCRDVELSNFVWFLSKTRCNDEDILVMLARRSLDPTILESCSAECACRILTSFTSLLDSSPSDMKEMRPLLSQLFDGLGTHLLLQSSQLTPSRISAAMQAYAKASYLQDMGIFDHLARQLEMMLDDCTVRQVTQGLWACGKMSVYETEHGREVEPGPPYLAASRQYAIFLAARLHELTAKDVAQAIWASSRLGITELKIVYAFAYRARQVAPNCNSQEVASILWGLSGLGFDDREVISALTSSVTDLHPTSQEAATVLYALGRMGIGDDGIFASMSSVMMKQLETTSAQAIANALWAYRAVNLAPPQQLIDTWAIQKLGLNGVQIYRSDSF